MEAEKPEGRVVLEKDEVNLGYFIRGQQQIRGLTILNRDGRLRQIPAHASQNVGIQTLASPRTVCC